MFAGGLGGFRQREKHGRVESQSQNALRSIQIAKVHSDRFWKVRAASWFDDGAQLRRPTILRTLHGR